MIYLTFTEQHQWFLHTFWQARTSSPAKPSSHLSYLMWGWSHGLLLCPWTFWVSSHPTSKDHGQNASDGGRCPIQGVQSPLRGTMSAGQRLDARETHSPGSKSLANTTLTFPCSNLFGHFWGFQRNDRTLVTKPSPTCLNSPCCLRTGIVWNHLTLHCCHQVTSCQTKVTFSSFQGCFLLNCSQWGHQLFLTLHTKLYFCLYFKQLEHKHKAMRISH